MRKKYFVNTQMQPNGDHEVHESECRKFPSREHAKYLGEFDTCHPAVDLAKKMGYNANGCIHCCTACNTH